MTRHAGPGPEAGPPPLPEPSYAERARTLVHLGRAGALSTLSRRQPGHPFGSVMPYAPDEAGAPLLLISSMAMHTQNLEADSRASLLVTQPGWTEDPLAGGRVTLMGSAARVTAAERTTVRDRYLARHPRAAYWVDFEDFSFWRLAVVELYFVGGFAAMDWVAGAGYAEARPDPLADAAEEIIAHMNRDHAKALLTLARAHLDPSAEEATMLSVDRLGFRLRVRSGERLHGARIGFPSEVTTADQCRTAFVEMLGRAPR
jgi:putative heme iron utilization protein